MGSGKENDVCILILLFYCLFIWFLWEKGGEGGSWREESGVLAGGRRKESRLFLIARCPSFTTRTTSTRPVFDNLYC